MATDVRWEGFSHRDLHDMAFGGVGPEAGFTVARQLRACTAELLAVDADLKAALDALGTVWTGRAASAAGAGFTPLGRWVADADVALSNAGFAHEEHGHAVEAVRRAMPPPPPMRTEVGPFIEDQAADEAAEDQLRLRAIEVMRNYGDGLPGRRDLLMPTGEPPVVTVAGAPGGVAAGGAGGGSGWSPGSPVAPSVAGFAPAGGGGSVSAPPTPGAGLPAGVGATAVPGAPSGIAPGGGGGSSTGSVGLQPTTLSPSAGGLLPPGHGYAPAGGRTPGQGSSGWGSPAWGPAPGGSPGWGAADRGAANRGTAYGPESYGRSGGPGSGGSGSPGSGRWGGGTSGGWAGGGRAGSGGAGSGGAGGGGGTVADPGHGGRYPGGGTDPVGRPAGEGAPRTGRGAGSHQMFPPMMGAGSGSGGPTGRQRPGYLIDDSGAFDVDHLPFTVPVIGEE